MNRTSLRRIAAPSIAALTLGLAVFVGGALTGGTIDMGTVATDAAQAEALQQVCSEVLIGFHTIACYLAPILPALSARARALFGVAPLLSLATGDYAYARRINVGLADAVQRGARGADAYVDVFAASAGPELGRGLGLDGRRDDREVQPACRPGRRRRSPCGRHQQPCCDRSTAGGARRRPSPCSPW